MKNKMEDLTNHLFAEIERLGDEDLSGDELAQEVERAKAIGSVAGHILNSADLTIKAEKLRLEYGENQIKLLGE